MSNTQSLRKKAYDHIRKRVINGEYPPGTQLVNRNLANELGTSFIPVREAISQLASEGIVEQVAGAGAFVRTFDRQEISELYDVRELFEPFAASQAARFMTDAELSEIESVYNKWSDLASTILQRKRGATAADHEAWLELNEVFHERLITGSRNRFLSKLTSDLHLLTLCFASHRGAPKLLSEDLVTSTLQTHKQLLDALLARDGEAAQEIILTQLKYGRETVLNFFDQNAETR